MIKFFRKIRQNLLSEGKTGKYFKYAIGEIVLVVIGILIALQLNTWKADIEERKIETSHLQNIREDLKQQLGITEAQMTHERMLTSKADSSYSYFNGKITITQLESLLYGSNSLGHRKTFIKSNSSYNELLNTGGLHLIKNLDLRKEIMRYQEQLEYTSMVINTNNGLIDDMFNKLSSSNAASFSLDANGNLETTIDFDGQERYKIRHSIEMRRNLSQIALEFCELQLASTKDLVSKIDRVLKK